MEKKLKVKSKEKKTKNEEVKTSKKTSGKPSSAKATAGKEPQTMEELLMQEGISLRGFKKGETLEGTITAISRREILIDIGGKTEGIVADKEMEMFDEFLADLKVGQKVMCVVISQENDRGQVVFSLRKAGADLKWKKMEEMMEKKEAVTVRGAEVNKGGIIVSVDGLRGFVPSSQLAYSHSGKINELVNKEISVLVIEVNKSQNRLIFSEKAMGGKEMRGVNKENLEKFVIGESHEGIVTGVVPYGLFINVDGIDGLVHISEIAWEKVNSPGDYFKVGDKVKVVILGIEEQSGKLNLSIKQLSTDPWKEAAKKYAVGKTIKGKISRISPFGSFVTLELGIEGLIHISKIPVGKEFKEGEVMECTVESVDPDKRRISLSPILKEKPMGYK